jgi:hypothetical protein
VEIFASSQEFSADSSSVVGAKNLVKICLQIAIKLCNIECYDVFAGVGPLLLAQYLQQNRVENSPHELGRNDYE